MSEFTDYLKQLGEIQVTKQDFVGLMKTDIKDLDVANSLRKLGNLQVMEWDFKKVLPAANRLAHQEIDVVDLVKRIANYKVLDWDFRKGTTAAAPLKKRLSPAEMQALMARLEAFLKYLVANLVDEPGHARIWVQKVEPNVLRFKVELVNRDVVMLIGREGHTAAAIRSVLKAVARKHGVHALLEIRAYD